MKPLLLILPIAADVEKRVRMKWFFRTFILLSHTPKTFLFPLHDYFWLKGKKGGKKCIRGLPQLCAGQLYSLRWHLSFAKERSARVNHRPWDHCSHSLRSDVSCSERTLSNKSSYFNFMCNWFSIERATLCPCRENTGMEKTVCHKTSKYWLWHSVT